MLIAGVLCVGAAITLAALGLWSLSRSSAANTARLSPRFTKVATTPSSVAPAQLAAAVMLAVGGALALAAPHQAAVRVGMCIGLCIVGAVGTVAAGSWQSARYALRREAAGVVCGGDCSACTFTSASRPCG